MINYVVISRIILGFKATMNCKPVCHDARSSRARFHVHKWFLVSASISWGLLRTEDSIASQIRQCFDVSAFEA